MFTRKQVTPPLLSLLLLSAMPALAAVNGTVSLTGSDLVAREYFVYYDSVFIRVADMDENVTGGVDAVGVLVTSDSEPDGEAVTLLETGAAGADGILQALASDRIRVAYTDTVDASTNTTVRNDSAWCLESVNYSLAANTT